MKKLILVASYLLFCQLVGAVTMSGISSKVVGQTQDILFNFSSSISNPKIFIAGNDLVVDFYATSYSQDNKKIEILQGYIHQITIASINNRTRAVIVGGGRYKYKLELNGSSLILHLSDQIGQSAMTKYQVGMIDTRSKSVSSDYSINIQDIKFIRDDNGGGVVEISYTGDTKLDISKERLGNSLAINLNGVNYSDSLIKKIDVTDFDTPIKYINTGAANGRLRIDIVNRNSWDYALYQLQNKLVINVRNLDKSNSSSIPSLKSGASDKVSFNFQNIDVRALLQLLADFSGYNILVSDSVTGTISIKLNNVPWDQALQTILSTKGLDMKRDGNVIRIAPASELAALSKQQQDSQKSFEAVEPLDTLTIRLKYSQAASVQSMILKPATAATGGATASLSNPNQAAGSSSPGASISGSNQPNQILSSRGSILTDTRTNTLIINDTPSRLKEVKDLIDKIDIPVKQVLIEGRIVEATSSFERVLGTRLLLAGVVGNATISNTLENGVTINQQGINVISAGAGGTTGGTTGGSTGGSAGGTSGATSYVNQNIGVSSGASLAAVFAPNSNTLIGLEVDALEQQNQGRTISSPKVMTANYQPANIQQGVQIPYQQASSAGNTNVAFVNATLSLQVTPQITDDGYILLNINIQKNTPSPTLQVQGTPAINTNSVTTQIRVKDGSTILVGGIYIDDQQKVIEQVPYLGDIPYLGWLFKAQQTTNSKRELLIFITPRVIANSLENDN